MAASPHFAEVHEHSLCQKTFDKVLINFAEQKIPWLSDWKDRIYNGIRSVLGPRIALLILFILVVLLPFVWSNWAEIHRWGIVRDVINYAMQPWLPLAKDDSYTILVAQLDGDDNGSHGTAIIESLKELRAVRAYQIRRRIDVSDSSNLSEVIKRASPQVQEYLKSTGAQIIIWGRVISINGKGVPKLYWSVRNEPERASFGSYPTGDSNELPPLFWDQLADVLRLVVVGDASKHNPDLKLNREVDLKVFISKVEGLLNEDRHGADLWPSSTAALVRVDLANALMILNALTGDINFLSDAAFNYRQALTRLSRTATPTRWAQVQNNLGLPGNLWVDFADSGRIVPTYPPRRTSMVWIRTTYAAVDKSTPVN